MKVLPGVLSSLTLMSVVTAQVKPVASESYDLYLTRIAAAEAYLQLNKIGTARQFLDACEPANRGLEWSFLDAALDRSAGSRPWSASDDNGAIAVGPDGSILAAGRDDGAIVLLRLPGFDSIAVLAGHSRSVTSLHFDASGRRLVSAGRDRAVAVWSVPERRLAWKNDSAFSQGVYEARFSPDGRQVAAASWELRRGSPPLMGFAKLLDASSGMVERRIDTEPHPASGVVFHPDGKSIVVATWGQITYAYSTVTGDTLWQYDLSDPSEYNAFHSIDMSPDGSTILLGSTDSRVHALDASTGALKRRIEPWEGHAKTIKAVRYAPDGSMFATAGEDQTILVWRSSDLTLLHRLVGHTRTVHAVSWSPDGTTLTSVSADRTLRSWNVARPFVRSFKLCNNGPWRVPVSADGRWFAGACSDESISVFEMQTGRTVATLKGQSALSGAFSPDGRFLYSASFDGIARKWDIASGTEVRKFEGHRSRIDGLVVGPKSGRLFTVADTTLRVWNTETGTADVVPFGARPFRVEVAADESAIVVGFGNGDLAVLDPTTYAVRNRTSSGSRLFEFAVSPDGRRLASWHGDGAVRVWDARTLSQTTMLRGHDKTGYAVGFTPDGRYLVTGAYDETFRFWDLERGRSTLTFHGHDETIYTAQFIGSAGRLLVGSSGGNVWYYENRPAGK